MMGAGRPRLGTILVSQGVISQAELEAAVLYQLRTESVAGRMILAEATEAGKWASRSPRLGEALIDLGVCTEEQIARALAVQMDVPFVDLRETPPEPEAVRGVPREVAREYGVVPLRVEGEILVLAVTGLPSPKEEERMRAALGRPFSLACAAEGQIREFLRSYPTPDVEPDDGAAAESSDPTPAALVREWVAEAARKGASDLYLEPLRDRVCVQYRVGARLHAAATLQPAQLRGVVAHVKMLCGMEVTERPRPQHGRCHFRIDGRYIEVQAATLPGAYGEGAVLRVLG